MNWVGVCRFGPKLRQNVATASKNPLEPLWTPKTIKNQKISEFLISPPSLFSPDPPSSPLGY